MNASSADSDSSGYFTPISYLPHIFQKKKTKARSSKKSRKPCKFADVTSQTDRTLFCDRTCQVEIPFKDTGTDATPQIHNQSTNTSILSLASKAPQNKKQETNPGSSKFRMLRSRSSKQCHKTSVHAKCQTEHPSLCNRKCQVQIHPSLCDQNCQVDIRPSISDKKFQVKTRIRKRQVGTPFNDGSDVALYNNKTASKKKSSKPKPNCKKKYNITVCCGKSHKSSELKSKNTVCQTPRVCLCNRKCQVFQDKPTGIRFPEASFPNGNQFPKPKVPYKTNHKKKCQDASTQTPPYNRNELIISKETPTQTLLEEHEIIPKESSQPETFFQDFPNRIRSTDMFSKSSFQDILNRLPSGEFLSEPPLQDNPSTPSDVILSQYNPNTIPDEVSLTNIPPQDELTVAEKQRIRREEEKKLTELERRSYN